MSFNTIWRQIKIYTMAIYVKFTLALQAHSQAVLCMHLRELCNSFHINVRESVFAYIIIKSIHSRNNYFSISTWNRGALCARQSAIVFAQCLPYNFAYIFFFSLFFISFLFLRINLLFYYCGSWRVNHSFFFLSHWQ